MKKFARFFAGALMAVAALAFVSCDKDDNTESKEPTFAGRQWVSESVENMGGMYSVYIFDFDNQKKGYILLAAEAKMLNSETEEPKMGLISLSENGVPMSAIQELEANNPAAPYKYRVDVTNTMFFRFYMVNKNTMKVALCSSAHGEEEVFGEFIFTPAIRERNMSEAESLK